MTEDPRLAFRFDCGATWLNLLATRGQHFGDRPVERLATVERLAQWLAEAELTPSEPLTADDLGLTWESREILRPIALATVGGVPPASEEVAALERFITDHPAPLRLGLTDRLVRDRPSNLGEALGRIARQAVAHLTGPEREQLSSCPEHDCRGVFSDPSGRRRWCPSPACASRGRVRAHRARLSERVG